MISIRLYLLVCVFSLAYGQASVDEPCEDKRKHCPSSARRGLCTLNREVSEFCPKSCHFCQRRAHKFESIVHPDFDCGRPYPSKPVHAKMQIRSESVLDSAIHPPGEQVSTLSQNRDAGVSHTSCGATVIHPHYLVTSAHCVIGPNYESLIRSVRLGELDLSSSNESNSRPRDYKIETVILHPDFSLVENYNNIALLKTEQEIQFNEFIFPMCIAQQRPTPNTIVTVSGFGLVNKTNRSTILQEASLNVISLSDCEESYRRKNLVEFLKKRYPTLLQGSDAMCAFYPGRAPCEGDEGGPLFLDAQDGRRYLTGIVSFVVSCRQERVPDVPSVYSSVSDHLNFIDSIIYGT